MEILKNAIVAMLMSGKVDFKAKSFTDLRGVCCNAKRISSSRRHNNPKCLYI